VYGNQVWKSGAIEVTHTHTRSVVVHWQLIATAIAIILCILRHHPTSVKNISSQVVNDIHGFKQPHKLLNRVGAGMITDPWNTTQHLQVFKGIKINKLTHCTQHPSIPAGNSVGGGVHKHVYQNKATTREIHI
jgi:hypothetical protein